MKNAAVIAEYNPFHNGHLRQFEILRSSGAETITVIMNGNHVQRGEPSVLKKHTRAEIAVRCGADLVIELPFLFGVSSAQGFAEGAVGTLNGCGVIDTLCFGSERVNCDDFFETAKKYFDADEKGLIKKHLDLGVSYPKAISLALEDLNARFIPESPNDLLGFEYVKALLRSNSQIRPFTHSRNTQYSSVVADGVASASASAIRAMMSENSEYGDYIPEVSSQFIKRDASACSSFEYTNFERVILSLIRMAKNNPSNFSCDNDTDGLRARILKYGDSTSLDELYRQVKTKRYTLTSVRRNVLLLAYGFSGALPEPEYIRVLAFNDTGRKLLAEMRKLSKLPIFHALPAQLKASPLVKYEALSTDMYNLYTPKVFPAGEDFRLNSIYVTM